ncbi:DNA polymerase delta small subunit Cdc1, partial [Friedmanniomyces endolithicus]
MPLKPNVLEDIGKEHWIAAPPPRVKYDTGVGLGGDSERGAHAGGGKGLAGAQIMLEDESGRLRLTGGYLSGGLLVTGAIVAVMGTENSDGDFEILDLRVPDLPRQPPRWETEDGDAALQGKSVTTKRPISGKVAIISGLGVSGVEGDTLLLDLLL